jgi:hypothetical protein
MEHLGFAVTLFAAAAALALLEIEIEGDRGWASGLPTWRVQNRWTRVLLGSRALTGYHLYAHLFVLVMAHLPFGLGLVPFGWSAELRVVAFLILFWILEDFLWFVFNPAFGIRRFTREHVWWHGPSWWGIMPREYWVFAPLGVGIYALSWRI